MKTKGILAVVLAALLSFGAGIGTLAYYQSTFTSQGDFQSEEWDVSAEEIVAGLQFEKTFTNLDLAPGRDEIYNFRIRRNDTEVDYIIKIDVEPTGDLFSAQGLINTPVLLTLGSDTVTPITLTIADLIDGDYELVVPNTGAYADFFTLKVEWPWETSNFVDPLTGDSYDNLFADKTGNIKVRVDVVQKEDWGEAATMRVRMTKNELPAYTAIAAHLGVVDDSTIDKTITGRMEIVGNNVTFKADDSEFGVVELHNKSLEFVTLGANVNLNSVYNIGINGDANITSTKTQTWLKFVD